MCYTLCMDENKNYMGFYIIEDCDLCNSTGIIIVPKANGMGDEHTECPLCDGKGSLKRKPK